MSQLDFQSALTRLLSDSPLRARFVAAPCRVAEELAADPADATALAAICPEELARQAEALLRKRQSQVAEIIPRTWKQAGTAAIGLFREYAEQSAWPTGHLRHFLDAASFCQFLKSRTPDLPVAAEHRWSSFVAEGRRLTVRLDFRLPVGNRTAWGVQLLYRNIHGVPRQMTFSISGHSPGC